MSSSDSKMRNSIISTATNFGDELNRVKMELAFERQCNSELGRRNAKYMKIIEKFEAHRMSMDTKLHLVLHKLSQLHDIANEAGESESSEIMDLLRSSNVLCNEMLQINSESNFSTKESKSSVSMQQGSQQESALKRRSRRGSVSATVDFDQLRRSAQYVQQESNDVQHSQNISIDLTKKVDVDDKKITSDIHIDSKDFKCENMSEPLCVAGQSHFVTSAESLESTGNADSESTPRTWNNSESPLFEHFLMIGCLEKDILEFSRLVSKNEPSIQSVTGDSITDRIKRTIMTGIFSSPRQPSQNFNQNNSNNSFVTSDSALPSLGINSVESISLNEVPSVHDTTGRGSLAGLSSLTESVFKSTTATAGSAGSTLSKLGGSFFNKMNTTVPFTLSPQRSLSSAGTNSATTIDAGVADVSPVRPENDVMQKGVIDRRQESMDVNAVDSSIIDSVPPLRMVSEAPSSGIATDIPHSSSVHQIQSSKSPRNVPQSENFESGILFSDIKGGRAVLQPTVLFQFPDDAPRQLSNSTGSTQQYEQVKELISGFSLPAGASLQTVSPIHDEHLLKDILYPRATGQRFAQRCMVFWFEDKNNAANSSGDRAGEKMYGICLMSPRVVLVGSGDEATSSDSERFEFGRNSVDSSLNETGGMESISIPLNNQQKKMNQKRQKAQVFVTQTCYVFVTRFPLFDFFFRVLQDILAIEKLYRMQMQQSQGLQQNANSLLESDIYRSYYNNDPENRGNGANYFGISEVVLKGVLQRLARLSVPSVAQSLHCRLTSPYVPNTSKDHCEEGNNVNEGDSLLTLSLSQMNYDYTRRRPRFGWNEHDSQVAQWTLSMSNGDNSGTGLLSVLPLEMSLWVLSLLMCEAKCVVCSKHAGYVSVVTNALLFLLRPLEWAGPFIPVIPAKMVEFVESPVPILAGVQLSDDVHALQLAHILMRCRENNQHLLTVVVDIDSHQLLVPAVYADNQADFCMPSMESLVQKLHQILRQQSQYQFDRQSMTVGDSDNFPHLKNSSEEDDAAFIICDHIATHIEALCIMARSVAEKEKLRLDKEHEEKMKRRQMHKQLEERRIAAMESKQFPAKSSNDESDGDSDEETSRAEQLQLYYAQLAELAVNDEQQKQQSFSGGMDLRALFSAAMMTPRSGAGHSSVNNDENLDRWVSLNHLDFTSNQEKFMEQFVSTQIYSSFSSMSPLTE